MSAWSARRQITFFFILILLFMAAAAGVLFWYWPRPDCQDGRQNQDESGVDCGGGCSAVCPFEARSVQMIWSRILPLGAGVYDAAVLVENPNANLALTDLAYSLRVVDDDNLFITRISGSLSLAPGEQWLIFKTNINVGRRQPARVLVDFSSPSVWRRSAEKSNLSVSDRQFTPGPVPLLKAKLTNQSLMSYRDFEVAVVLSDDEHNGFAASQTAVSELAPGETKEISFSWPRPFSITAPAFIDFYPHVAIGNLVN
ncbi:MAG: hypothetical protein HYT46_02180 [Candidatus Vogelbacteria bacterium]|nr:hypothetical protein [Candidatus Vogelbacteria bacterium]